MGRLSSLMEPDTPLQTPPLQTNPSPLQTKLLTVKEPCDVWGGGALGLAGQGGVLAVQHRRVHGGLNQHRGRRYKIRILG